MGVPPSSQDCTCVQTAKVTLSSAQILNSFTTPVQLIAAPGAGKVIFVTHFLINFNFNTVAYATNTDGGFEIGGIFSNLIALNFPESGFAGRSFTLASYSALENAAFNFQTDTGNPTEGDSTIDL